MEADIFIDFTRKHKLFKTPYTACIIVFFLILFYYVHHIKSRIWLYNLGRILFHSIIHVLLNILFFSPVSTFRRGTFPAGHMLLPFRESVQGLPPPERTQLHHTTMQISPCQVLCGTEQVWMIPQLIITHDSWSSYPTAFFLISLMFLTKYSIPHNHSDIQRQLLYATAQNPLCKY